MLPEKPKLPATTSQTMKEFKRKSRFNVFDRNERVSCFWANAAIGRLHCRLQSRIPRTGLQINGVPQKGKSGQGPPQHLMCGLYDNFPWLPPQRRWPCKGTRKWSLQLVPHFHKNSASHPFLKSHLEVATSHLQTCCFWDDQAKGHGGSLPKRCERKNLDFS